MRERAEIQIRCLIWAGALCCSGAGCGRPSDHLAVHPVVGKVLFDGHPVGGAMVVLHPQDGAGQAVRPLGYTKDDGSFKIATYDAGDGAPAGKYVATVEWLVRPKGKEDDPIVVPNKLPPRYGNPQSSRLAVEVVAGTNDLPPFQLTR